MTPTPPFAAEWTTPKPPRGWPVRPIRGRWGWVAAGVALGVVGHIVANGIIVLSTIILLLFFETAVVMHLGLFLLCLIGGLKQLNNGDRALGLGVMIGWLVGAAGTAALMFWGYQALLDY